MVSPLVCYRGCLQYSADDGREPRRICCWYGWRPVPCVPTSQQLERWASPPGVPSCLSLNIYVHAQVFVSSSPHVPVYLLAYSSCSNTGVFVRLCMWITADCLVRLGRKSYVAEYSVDVKCLWMTSSYRIMEIYVQYIYTPNFLRFHSMVLRLVNTYPQGRWTA